MMPGESPQSFVCTGEGLPRSCFGEIGQREDVRFVAANTGRCEVCSTHCPTFTEPQPARLWRLACGRKACALCYQFEKTRNAARRLRTNTIHYYNVMKQLELLEKYTTAIVDENLSQLQEVLPSPPLVNMHNVPIRPRFSPSSVGARQSLSALPERRRSISRPSQRSPEVEHDSLTSHSVAQKHLLEEASCPSQVALWNSMATSFDTSAPVDEAQRGTEIAELLTESADIESQDSGASSSHARASHAPMTHEHDGPEP
jgi:hypothetical protein